MANEKGIHCAGLINILPEVDAMFQQAIQTSICSYDPMINLQGHLWLFFYWPRLLSIVYIYIYIYIYYINIIK